MGRYKYLLKNIGLLMLSSFATKLLSFFLLPLYTYILSATEYGIYDLFNTTIGILLPVLTLNIQESLLRFTLDNSLSRKSIISIGTRYFAISNVLVLLGLTLNEIFGFSLLIKEYALLFFLMYFTQTLSNMVMAYIRGIERIMDLSVSSVVNSVVIVCCNVLFLIVFNWGLTGYFLANIIGPIIQCFYLMVRAGAFKEIDLKERYPVETREMLTYSKPIVANSIAWWINNAADKYIVIFFCGLAENGIYSVASKIPSILNIFQSIFAQAWTLSAVKDFDPEDKNGFFAKTYAVYNCLMVIMCSALIVLSKILAGFLYAKDFYVAWMYVPWLTIAIVFGSLSGYIGGFFSAVKNSKMFAQSTMIGAATNIVLNLILTPLTGALGAAIATAICYCVTWAFRYVHAKKIIHLKVDLGRDIFTYTLLVVQSVLLMSVSKSQLLYFLECILFLIILSLYYKNILLILKKCFNLYVTKIKK